MSGAKGAQATAPLASLRIDADDLAFDLLPGLERSFGVVLDRDLRHVVTVGDLYALLCTARARGSWTGESAGCATQMAFYRLRAVLHQFGLERCARPDTRLASSRLPAPKRFKATVERETGLTLPAPPGSWQALLGCLGLPSSAVLGLIERNGWLALAGLLVALVLIKVDRCRWTGTYASLRSLATATAALNHRAFVAAGARNAEDDVWRVVVNSFANLGTERGRIGEGTRLLA